MLARGVLDELGLVGKLTRIDAVELELLVDILLLDLEVGRNVDRPGEEGWLVE